MTERQIELLVFLSSMCLCIGGSVRRRILEHFGYTRPLIERLIWFELIQQTLPDFNTKDSHVYYKPTKKGLEELAKYAKIPRRLHKIVG